MIDDEEDEKPKSVQRVYGALDTELTIEHKRIPTRAVDNFVDGWVTGRRREPFVRTRYNVTRPKDEDWNYGYDLALASRLFFSQALHSFLEMLERKRRM